MNSTISDRSNVSMLVLGVMMGLVSLLNVTTPATAQVMPITASEVMDRETFEAFVEGAKAAAQAVTDPNDVAPFVKSLSQEGIWKHGNTFLILMQPDGTVYAHGGDTSVNTKNIFHVTDDRGNAVVQDLIAAANMGGGHVDYYWDDPGQEGDEDTAKVAYATSYASGITGTTVIMIGRFYQDVSDAAVPLIDPSIIPVPAVTAADVVDRPTLMAFVQETIKSYRTAAESIGLERLLQNQEIFRQEGGPWRQGSVYFFAFTTEGYVFFHGADRTQEHEYRINLEDINGVKFIQELIRVAKEGGGFVEYHYNDPAVTGDEDTGTPKVSYAELVTFEGSELVLGAGFYRRPVDDVPEITLEVEPATVTEGRDGQEVTVTATLTDDPVPVATIIDLALEGTATSDDYTADGTLEIVIPANSTSASTTLTFNVVDDGMEDADETIVVKASYEVNDLASATIAVDDRVLPVTAAEVMDRESLKGFVEGAKEHFLRFTSADDTAILISDLRNEGDFNSGDTFLIIFFPNGSVFIHGGDPSLDGINASELEDDNGVKVVQKLIEAAAAGGDFVEYTWDDPDVAGDDPARVAYATSAGGDITQREWVLVGGFVQDIPDEEITDLPGPPEVWARDVVDKKTLKAFVQGAARWSEDALVAVGLSNLGKVKEIFREEGGPWKSGAVYLFSMTANGYVLFHGADVNQEGKIQTHLEDKNGVRFVEKLIETALAGGGFVEYYYDDPSVEGDEELGSPKVSYAEAIIVPELFPGVPIVLGAGFYRRPVDDVPEITLEVEPATVTEGRDGQEVTVTATLTDDPVPVATIIDLALEGTATSDDYTADGTLEIVIPANSTSASTTLTFNVVDDGMEDADETIVVKASYEVNDLASATIAVDDRVLPVTAAEVMDRESLKGFVEGAKEHFLRFTSADDTAILISDLRNEGDFNSGDTFLIIFFPNGSVFIHGGDPSLDGINASELEDDNGVKVVQKLIEAAAAGGDFVEYTWDDPDVAGDDPARVAYATSAGGDITQREWVLVGGFVQDIPDEEITDLPGPPEVWARDVVDKKTLKAFVQGAARWSEDALVAVGLSNLGKVKEIFREEGGPWKSGAVYLFSMTANGYVLFHGADVNQEGKIQTHLEDKNGVRFVEKLIETALAGGGFVEYYYDDPSVEGDEELGSPKVSYAEAIIVPELFPGVPIVLGAGFYRRPVDDVPEITLEVEPATVTEGRDGQEVTVTATLTDDPVPVATIIDLALEGTATSDDYTADGTLEIVIPANSTSASTTLTFNVVDDGMEDADETIVVKASYEGNDLASATIAVKDAFRAPHGFLSTGATLAWTA